MLFNVITNGFWIYYTILTYLFIRYSASNPTIYFSIYLPTLFLALGFRRVEAKKIWNVYYKYWKNAAEYIVNPEKEKTNENLTSRLKNVSAKRPKQLFAKVLIAAYENVFYFFGLAVGLDFIVKYIGPHYGIFLPSLNTAFLILFFAIFIVWEIAIRYYVKKKLS